MLHIDSLVVNYHERLVLRGVSLDVPSGSTTALIGPNGSGKTTLIRAVSGVLPIQGGRVEADGCDLGMLSPLERARRIAVVPQARQLPPAFTAWETVLLGRTPYLNWLGQLSARDEEAARRAMERTQTLELSERRIGELSGGEQQRVLLARALAQSAPILLLDEPTAHLDLQYQVSLLDLIHSLAKEENLAVLFALHDLNLTARYADQVALIQQGVLRAVGTPVEVLKPELLSEVYQVPLEVVGTSSDGHPFLAPR
jgi:iron complex transport system ATP-binding protein